MTKMADFTLEELMLFIIGVLGATGGLLLTLQKSKCEEIGCCGCHIKRRVDLVIAEEKLEKTGHTGETPRLLSEPEPEQNNNN